MRDFFDGLDAAATPVPKDERLAAALGPKMLDLAKERSLGTHPYFIDVEHTRFARERLGPGRARRPRGRRRGRDGSRDGPQARPRVREALPGPANYTNNLLKFGYTERDIADGGSDRLIDAVIPHGSPEQIADAVRAHLDAGADHVCLQPLGHGPEPLEDFAALAKVLL